MYPAGIHPDVQAKMKRDEDQARELDRVRSVVHLPEPAATLPAPPNLQVQWDKEKAKGADLGDAVEFGYRDPEADVARSMSDMTTAAKDYHRRLVELLTALATILEDGLNDFDRLQARFTRNP